MSSTRKALLISLGDRYARIAINLISMVALARLLTPEDIGLFSVCVALVSLAQVIRNFGINNYLIQEDDLSEENVRTAFTLTLIMSLSLFALFQLISGPISIFYKKDGVENVLRILSINFLLIPFNVTTLALLRRELKFGVLFYINISATIVGALVAITLATMGFGYWSLVLSSIANTATTVTGGYIYRRNEFFLRPSLASWRRVFKFGSKASFASIITEVAININDLVVGRVLGMAPVAIINKAQGTMAIFHRDIMSAINNVAYPAFAMAYREGKNLEELHSRSVTSVVAFAWPFYGFLSIFPLEVVRTLFGNQWDEAASLVPVFCAAGAVAALWNLNQSLIMAAQRMDILMRAEIVVQFGRIIAIVLCALIFDDLLPFALTFFGIYLVALPIYYIAKSKVIENIWEERIPGLISGFQLTVITLSLPLAFKYYILSSKIVVNDVVIVLIAGGMTLVGWILGLRVLQHQVLYDPMVPDAVKKFVLYKYRKNKEV